MTTNIVQIQNTFKPFALQSDQVAPFVLGFLVSCVVLTLAFFVLLRFFGTPVKGERQT